MVSAPVPTVKATARRRTSSGRRRGVSATSSAPMAGTTTIAVSSGKLAVAS
jgi:hypothetical protein